MGEEGGGLTKMGGLGLFLSYSSMIIKSSRGSESSSPQILTDLYNSLQKINFITKHINNKL